MMWLRRQGMEPSAKVEGLASVGKMTGSIVTGEKGGGVDVGACRSSLPVALISSVIRN